MDIEKEFETQCNAEVAPLVTTTNPKTDLYPCVAVTWGRCPQTRTVWNDGWGERNQYILSMGTDGKIMASYSTAKDRRFAWIGDGGMVPRPAEECPQHIQDMAMRHLKTEQYRRFDGCTYVVPVEE